MNKRGRPAQNGKKPGWMLGRTTIALSAYDQARKAGEKLWLVKTKRRLVFLLQHVPSMNGAGSANDLTDTKDGARNKWKSLAHKVQKWMSLRLIVHESSSYLRWFRLQPCSGGAIHRVWATK
jgi:hypothetical protein